MNLEDFVYIPPPDQEPIVADKQYFFRDEWFFSVEQNSKDKPWSKCSCPTCEEYRDEMVKKQTNIE